MESLTSSLGLGVGDLTCVLLPDDQPRSSLGGKDLLGDGFGDGREMRVRCPIDQPLLNSRFQAPSLLLKARLVSLAKVGHTWWQSCMSR